MSNDEKDLEAEAAADFAREKQLDVVPVEQPTSTDTKKRPNRAEARRNAVAASDVARAFLAEPAPVLDNKPAPVETLPAPPDTNLARCDCGRELGHAVHGVFANDRWYCPRCFMRDGRNYSTHPVARAVECPTCHRETVDFSGRNQCPVCRARGARPIRAN